MESAFITKTMIVDGIWSVVGSSNLAESRLQTYRRWYRRPLFERAYEWVGALLERQQ